MQIIEWGCRDGIHALCEKWWRQGNPLINTIKDILPRDIHNHAYIIYNPLPVYNPLPELCREGLRSILGSIAKEITLVSLILGFAFI